MSKDYYLEITDEANSLKLPSDIEKEKSVKRKKFNKSFKNVKWTGIIFFLVLIYLFYEPFLEYFFEILARNPTVYSIYLYIENHIVNLTLTGLYFFSIMSTLFFLILPSEATFIYFLDSTNYFFLSIFLFALLGNVTGMAFNYLFGRILGERVIKWLFKEKNYFKYKDTIEKYGGYLLFLGNIFPGPIEFIAVFYGGFKFPFTRYLYLVFMGRLIKYVLLFIAFTFWWDSIVFYYDEVITDLESLFEF